MRERQFSGNQIGSMTGRNWSIAAVPVKAKTVAMLVAEV